MRSYEFRLFGAKSFSRSIIIFWITRIKRIKTDFVRAIVLKPMIIIYNSFIVVSGVNTFEKQKIAFRFKIYLLLYNNHDVV